MNAFVLYEQDKDGVTIQRVYYGEGAVYALHSTFRKEIRKLLGPKPDEVECDFKSPFTSPAMKWDSDLYLKTRPKEFGAWLVSRGWIECEDAHGVPL